MTEEKRNRIFMSMARVMGGDVREVFRVVTREYELGRVSA